MVCEHIACQNTSPSPPPPPWIRHCKFTSIFNSSCLNVRIWVARHSLTFSLPVFGFGIQPYLFCSQRSMFLLLRVRKMKTSSNNFLWKGNIKWLKRFQVLLDPFVETSILFGILKYKHFTNKPLDNCYIKWSKTVNWLPSRV